MKIEIKDEKKIADVQKEFNLLFPFLKLEFFTRVHKPGEPSHKKILLNANGYTLGKFRRDHRNDALVITPNMTVSDLGEAFADIFGLSVQLFRHSGNIWLETTFSDYWTLEKQNREGEALSKAATGTATETGRRNRG